MTFMFEYFVIIFDYIITHYRASANNQKLTQKSWKIQSRLINMEIFRIIFGKHDGVKKIYFYYFLT